MGSIGSTFIQPIMDYKRHDISVPGGLLRYEVQKMEPDVIYIHGIDVQESNRGQGIGTQLLNKAKQMADNSGLNIELFAVPIKNNKMSTSELIKWYEKRGFTHEGANLMRYKTKRRK